MSSASNKVHLFNMYTHPDGPWYPYGNLFKSRRGTIPSAVQKKIRESCYAENIRVAIAHGVRAMMVTDITRVRIRLM